MRRPLLSRTLAVLITNSFLLSSLAFAQQPAREESRPRRTEAVRSSTPQSNIGPWHPPDNSLTQLDAPAEIKGGAEPMMRIALATDLRAASVSTNGLLMSATDLAQTLVPLDVARV